jgi:predicted PurR-regulated permease PerM
MPFLIVLTLSLIATVLMVAPFLVAVITGGITAVLAYPLYLRLQAREIGQKSAAFLVTLMVVLLIVGPLFTLIFLAVKQAAAMTNWSLSAHLPSVKDLLAMIADKSFVSAMGVDVGTLEEGLLSILRGLSRFATSFLLRLATEVPQFALQATLAILACFFLLLDGVRAVSWFTSLVPMNPAIQSRIKGAFRDTAISVIWASMAAAATQAGIMLLAFGILSIPAAFLAGGATFIFAWVPLLGSFPVWGSGILYLVMQGSYLKAIVLLGIGVFTSIIDNFVRPLVLKGRSEMHPMVSLIAIFGGIKMFGVIGVFLGPILIAVLLALLKIWPVIGQESGLEFPEDSQSR